MIVAREAHQVHAGRDTSGYSEGTRAVLAYGATVTDEQFERALAEQAELTAAVEASLAGLDALIGPAVGYQAPEQDPPFGLGDDNAEGRFTGPYNLTGHPALSLPVPMPAGSLPAGLQLAGRRGGGCRAAPGGRGCRACARRRTIRDGMSQEDYRCPAR